ncbi:MAG: 3-deoxy-7-phosphoheptulonate synthase [Eubacterium sp.]|nr:3-deoxy-7-phosphoheptulonate synthase [Eubacterium sp.]
MEMQMEFIRKLPTPQEIKEKYPISDEIKRIKEERDQEILDIFSGKKDKFLMIIGPCSADNEEAVVDYMNRLRKVQDKIQDRIFIIPRVYTNKPRTTGTGYKGMLHQPDPEGHEDMLEGIIAIRKLHTRVANETGFTCAEEMLYPSNHRYLSDLLSYIAVGARSVEDQEHRIVSSGVGIPVGMKNPPSGDISVMMNAVTAAQSAQDFIYRGWEVRTNGNPYAHCIMRGYIDNLGHVNKANYHYEDLITVYEEYQKRNLKHPAIIVDTNHANSNKQYLEQIRIAKDVIHSRQVSSEIRGIVKGLMIESYIEDGAQKIGEGIYGKSITDPCLGWEKTEKLLLDLAEIV